MHNINELLYTKNHTWIKTLGDGDYQVGITDFAQNELGDIVYFESPDIDHVYSQGDQCAVIESVKSASDIYCPLSGTIIRVNSVLKDLPEMINNDPYGKGWLFMMNTNKENELDDLIDADTYLKLTEEV